MKKRATFAAFAAIFLSSQADAALLGATVLVTGNYPSPDVVLSSTGPRTVTNLIEYPIGAFFNFNPGWRVDIGDDYLEIRNMALYDTTFSHADFNGFVFQVIDGPELLDASVASQTGFAPSSMYIQGGRLFLDFVGQTALSGAAARINLVTAGSAVPEPATWAMMVAGFAAVGGALRRRRPALA